MHNGKKSLLRATAANIDLNSECLVHRQRVFEGVVCWVLHLKVCPNEGQLSRQAIDLLHLLSLRHRDSI